MNSWGLLCGLLLTALAAPAQVAEPPPTGPPPPHLVLYKTGQQLFNEGKLDEAEAKFRECARAAPEVWQAHFQAGLCAYGMERYAQAYNDFSEVIDFMPDLAEAYVNRAKVSAKLGRNAVGCRDLEKAKLLGAAVDNTLYREVCLGSLGP